MFVAVVGRILDEQPVVPTILRLAYREKQIPDFSRTLKLILMTGDEDLNDGFWIP